MPYVHLMRLNKPIGIFLLLWPTLSALWISANGVPDLGILIVFILGVIVMRSAGCAINDYVDRNIDGSVFRTVKRPLVMGTLKVNHVLIAFSSLALFSLMLVLILNKITVLMSFIALFLTVTYPFVKRYTYLPQFHLGITFSCAIFMAFLGQNQLLSPVSWLLFLANILWVTSYDTYYAMSDREDDLLITIKSTAILFNHNDRCIIGILQAFFLLSMILIGILLDMSFVYYFGVLVSCIFFSYQYKLTKNRHPEGCLLAFASNNWVGAALFSGIVLYYGLGQ
ncbi:MAG: 4-hydroxybenzoate octaprenyltransferase [Piscirickettsiaceae bacterium]|nr:4-hydroxybenzoate octaprenyltransferase [Piscirickettsiaceae bacterium]